MKKVLLLIPALVLALAVNATTPSTDFSGGYTFAADDATLSGTAPSNKFFLKTDSDPHSIVWYDVAYGAAEATWNITATRSCYVSVSLDLGSYNNNKHIFEVKILQGSTEIGTVAEGAADPNGDTDGYKNDYDKVKPLEGSIFLPEAGEYTIELRNIRGYGKGAVNNVILTYAGGAQVDIPAANIPFGDAIFSTHAWLDKSGTSDSIRFARADHESEAADASYTVAGSEYVKWNVKVAKDGYYKFTANTYCKQGHNYRIMLLSADESSTIHTWQEAEGTGYDWNNQKANWEISTDAWDIPAGNYVLKVQARAYGRLLSLAGTYVGGAVQTLPTTTDNSESWFSPKGTRADGMITFTSYTNQWVKWNIAVPGSVTRAYNVALNINNPTEYGHRFSVSFYEPEAEEPFATLTESSWNKTYGTPVSIPMGIVNLEGGNRYIVKVTNSESGAQPKIISLSFTNAGGDVKAISTSENTSLNVADAWFSGCSRDNAKTYIQYPSSGTASAWIKWNIATSATKMYDLAANINTTHAHGFTVAIYEDEEADPVASITEGSYVSTTGDGLELELGRVNLVGGKNYVVKVTNAPDGSQAKVTSVVFAPVAASSTSLPNTLAFSNAVLSEKANITDGMLYFNEPGADKDPRGQWARWNVTTDHDGLFLFTMGTNSSNGQNYKISILDDSEHVIDSCQTTSLESGAKTIKHYFDLAAGDYSVKVENTRSYSKGHLTSLVVTEPGDVITIDEKATTITSWEDQLNVANVDVKIIRTLRGGMYNTFVLPFAISSDQAKEIFGENVEMYTLKQATVEDDYILNLELKSESSTYQGTPIFIKPANDVENPIFIDVTIKATTVGTTTKTNANFAGTFVKTTLGPDQDILFLAQDNMLYYPAVDIEVLGMRGWFVIHDSPAPAPQITRARIINNENVVTEIELVGNTLPTEFGDNQVTKRIDDGQLLIIRDGAIYNALGVRIK